MMRWTRYILLAIGLAAVAEAGAQALSWSRPLNGPSGQSATLGDGRIVTRSLARDASGAWLVSGSATSGAQRDFLVARISPTGALVWQRTLNGAAGGNDEAMSVAADPSGNAIVVGTAQNASNPDVRVLKLSAADGTPLWDRTFDGGRSDAGYFVAVDASGNPVVAVESLNAAGHWDVRVLKLAAANGATLWEQRPDTGRDDYVADVAVDAAGDVTLLGASANALGGFDVRVLRYAGSTGAIRWQRTIDFGGALAAYALALDASGNAYVTGGSGTAANMDYRTLKLAAGSGATLWERRYDGGRNDSAQALAVDAAGNVIVAGHSQNSAGRFVWKTFKYAADTGAVVWEGTFDGGVNDYAYQVAVDTAGNAVVVGSTTRSAGNRDWKVVFHRAADGAVLGQYTHAGAAAANDDAYAVGVDASGVVVGGLTSDSATVTTLRLLKLSPPPAPGTPPPPTTSPVNVALASAGAVASASSQQAGDFPVASVIDGQRTGLTWSRGGGWEDATSLSYPDWVQVNFKGAQPIDRVVVYTLADDYTSGAEPTDSTTFRSYGIVDFRVEAWTGSTWSVVGSVTGNNLVKRTFSFAPVTTDRIRVVVTRGQLFKSRIVEIEAWGAVAP